MGSLSKFRLDIDKSVEGQWFPFAEGIEVKIARMHNAEYDKYLDELRQPHIHQIRTGTLDVKTFDEITKKAMAKCVIRDWKNLQDEKGKEIKYSPEKAYEILNDPENEIFLGWIERISESVQLFIKEQKEQAVKN